MTYVSLKIIFQLEPAGTFFFLYARRVHLGSGFHLVTEIFMDSVKKVQDRLFKRASASTESVPEKDAGLTIKIPVHPPTSPNPNPNPPPKIAKPTESPPKDDDEVDTRSFRERLAAELGENYKGAERYRLAQDEARERHWKRWGPYLSDRQWVRV
jgi:hypothetical protein